jgi:hypothetical protein
VAILYPFLAQIYRRLGPFNHPVSLMKSLTTPRKLMIFGPAITSQQGFNSI